MNATLLLHAHVIVVVILYLFSEVVPALFSVMCAAISQRKCGHQTMAYCGFPFSLLVEGFKLMYNEDWTFRDEFEAPVMEMTTVLY